MNEENQNREPELLPTPGERRVYGIVPHAWDLLPVLAEPWTEPDLRQEVEVVRGPDGLPIPVRRGIPMITTGERDNPIINFAANGSQRWLDWLNAKYNGFAHYGPPIRAVDFRSDDFWKPSGTGTLNNPFYV
jgi:hypothetical protein